MIKTIDTEYFDEKIQAAMKNAMDITGSTWRWCPIALKAALELMPDVEPAQRCNCCGYLVTDSEHKGCLRAANQEPAQAVPVGKDWDNFATGFDAGWKECLDHCKPIYMYRRKGTFMPGQYVTCDKEQYFELLGKSQFETDIAYDTPASDYTKYVGKLKPPTTHPAPFDSDTRKMVLELCDTIIIGSIFGIITKAKKIRERLEAGNGE